jgi:hypothetical protein
MLLISKFSKYLKKKEILQIIKLKKTFWKYNLKSQISFFKKNYYKFDINNLLYKNKKLIGYNILKKRSFFIKNKKSKYYYLDTLIIDKNQRKKNYASNLMNLNNFLIKKNNLHGMLLCKKRTANFYKKFRWKIINNKKIILADKNTHLKKMFFNVPKSKENLSYYIYK